MPEPRLGQGADAGGELDRDLEPLRGREPSEALLVADLHLGGGVAVHRPEYRPRLPGRQPGIARLTSRRRAPPGTSSAVPGGSRSMRSTRSRGSFQSIENRTSTLSPAARSFDARSRRDLEGHDHRVHAHDLAGGVDEVVDGLVPHEHLIPATTGEGGRTTSPRTT